MGNIEDRNRERVRRSNIQRAVLAAVAATGALAVGLLAPNAITAVRKLGLLPHPRTGEVARSAASRLRNKGLLKFEGGKYQLTKIGERLLKQWELSDYKIPKPKKWDRKWRVIIFDVPERRRRSINAVRRIIAQAGLYRLQDSVWVYPYDCEDIIGILKNEFGLGRDMLYLIADEIENDRHLRREFDLPI